MQLHRVLGTFLVLLQGSGHAWNATLLGVCPAVIGANVTATGVQQQCIQLTSNVSVVQQDDSMLVLNHANITAVQSLPKEPHIIDLSFNSIAAIPRFESPSSVLELNLSHNNLTWKSSMHIPRNVNILDLSYNRINYWTFNFSKLTKLAELYLRGNGLTNVRFVNMLPPSLVKLDLSDNPIVTIDVDKATYSRSNDFNVEIIYASNNTISNWSCVGKNHSICVTGSSDDDDTDDDDDSKQDGDLTIDSNRSVLAVRAIVYWVALGVVVVLCIRLCYSQWKQYCYRRELNRRRPTMCSSACAVYDEAEIQIRDTISYDLSPRRPL
ncbi:unnamed protein product [Aphanomyces euteiches]